MGERLVRWIEDATGRKPEFLHGGVPAAKRMEMVDAFQNNPDSEVFILSLKAGGTGLNLTAASAVIHYDLWWNPAVEDQGLGPSLANRSAPGCGGLSLHHSRHL